MTKQDAVAQWVVRVEDAEQRIVNIAHGWATEPTEEGKQRHLTRLAEAVAAHQATLTAVAQSGKYMPYEVAKRRVENHDAKGR